MARRFSVNSVLDVSSLNGYYGRLDVFASFTDDGEYDLDARIDGNIRPHGVYGYMINDVVGRTSRETTLYARVFRYKTVSNDSLDVQKYTMDKYEEDYKRLLKKFPKWEEELDEIHTLVPGQLRTKNAFAHIWQLLFRFAAKLKRGIQAVKLMWGELFEVLGYEAVVDKRGTGVISANRKPCIVIFGKENNWKSDVEDLEIVSTQVYKQEQNTQMFQKIARFNESTKVANARRRIKKW